MFVLSTTRPDAVLDFYRRVTGWELGAISAFPDGGPAGPGGQRFFVREGPVGWLAFLTVVDLPAVLKRVQAAGGRAVHPLPDDRTGRVAAVFDPSETRLGLYQPDGAVAGSDTVKPEPGMVVWIEQKTRDQDAATAFHGKVFGFDAVGASGPGKVRLLRPESGPTFGGVMQFDDRWALDHPPHWLLYASVDDLDATIETAIEAGGSLWFPPTDTPLGLLAYVRDPDGNGVAVVKVSDKASAMLFTTPSGVE